MWHLGMTIALIIILLWEHFAYRNCSELCWFSTFLCVLPSRERMVPFLLPTAREVGETERVSGSRPARKFYK